MKTWSRAQRRTRPVDQDGIALPAALGFAKKNGVDTKDMPERLPNARRAYINPGKIRDYALNPKHAIGRFKAAFFAQMGYSQENWHMLIQDIQEQHLLADVEAG